MITADVRALRDQFQLPGMRVLQFAFDGHADNPYLPHNFVHNTVAYTGTHDNATTREWYEELPDYRAAELLELPQACTGNQCRCRSGVDAAGMVVTCGARDCSVAGSAQPGKRSAV